MNAVITALYQRLTGDAALMASATDLHHVWAPEDAQFPYLVHRLTNNHGNHWARRDATYYIDVWDYGGSAARAGQIRDRVVELLDRKRITGDGFAAARLYLVTDGLIPDEPGIQHWAIQFDLIYWRQKFIEQLIGG